MSLFSAIVKLEHGGTWAGYITLAAEGYDPRSVLFDIHVSIWKADERQQLLLRKFQLVWYMWFWWREGRDQLPNPRMNVRCLPSIR